MNNESFLYRLFFLIVSALLLLNGTESASQSLMRQRGAAGNDLGVIDSSIVSNSMLGSENATTSLPTTFENFDLSIKDPTDFYQNNPYVTEKLVNGGVTDEQISEFLMHNGVSDDATGNMDPHPRNL